MRNFRKPLLAVETEGHHAPVRVLLWRNPQSLLSAGQDKLVKLWDFRDGARPAGTIRPMIWRGPAGLIYSMALAQEPGGPPEQSLLAVGGYGVESRRGDITVYRVPGLTPSSTGDVVARLLPPREGQPIGHRDSVLALAFRQNGGTLASGGNDNQVILWDTTRVVVAASQPTFLPRRVLSGHTRPVRALAFLPPDGRRLVTASEDGTLRLWDVETGAELDRSPAHPTQPDILNALAVSPDGRSIVVGREGGGLFRFDASSLSRVAPVRFATGADQGPVEALAFSPDGRQLAVSIKSDRADRADAAALACDLELRTMSTGAVQERIRVPGLLYSLAFSPDGSRLAYSGGLAQAVYVKHLATPKAPPDELRGEGTTVFDLGFTADDRAIGFTREPNAAPPSSVYEGFDLTRRRAVALPNSALRHAIRTLGGWSLTGSVREYRLEAVNTDGRRWRLDLDPVKEGLWWSWTMIPPGPGHPRPTVAVGCAVGVLVYDLETGRRTRLYAGHTSPVVSVVPSHDGHWLASGSVDQTVMFYPLAGCDVRPGLGARFRQGPDRSWRVEAVVPKGFAAAMGLEPGDQLLEAGIDTRSPDRAGVVRRVKTMYQTPEQLGDFANRAADEMTPGDLIGVRVRKLISAPGVVSAAVTLALPTSKRDNAALMLLQDVKREWVLWTPQGYYDTSIEGDSRLLGWHRNPAYDQSQPTEFLPIATYEGALRKPEVLERLWTTHDLDRALAVLPRNMPSPEQLVTEEPPPRVAFEAVDAALTPEAGGGLWVATSARSRARLKLSAGAPAGVAGALVADREVVVDGRVLKPRQAVGPVASHEEVLDLDLPPGRRVRLLVTTANTRGRQRSGTIDLEFRPPRPVEPEPRPRHLVLALGANQFKDSRLPNVPFAERDVERIADFLGQHRLTAAGAKPEPFGPGKVLKGYAATNAALRGLLDDLDVRLREGKLRPGDLVSVIVATHLLTFPGDEAPLVSVFDSTYEPADTARVSARDLSELFGRLTDYGCRVALFLDGVHDGEFPAGIRSDPKSWVRDLQRNRRVVVFLASKEGPSEVAAQARHGKFALGILNALGAAGPVPTLGGPRPLSLDQFGSVVAREVLNLSNRQQQVGYYLPKGTAPWTPFLAP